MHVFTSFVLFEGEQFHGGGRVWYFNVIWLKSIHTFTFIVTVFTASASIRVSARNASLYIAVMIFCAQPYLKPCFMCPFYIMSTCPSKGLCTALLHMHINSLHTALCLYQWFSVSGLWTKNVWHRVTERRGILTILNANNCKIKVWQEKLVCL